MGSGGYVPIFGCEALEIANKTNWTFHHMGVTSSAAAVWAGDEVPMFNFSFDLFAGLHPIKTRKDLHEKIKLMTSWAQGQNEGNKIIAPPSVRLIINSYFSTTGVITECTCTAKGPWEVGEPYPTTCHFAGTFAVLPGYDGKATKILDITEKLNSKNIASKLFVF